MTGSLLIHSNELSIARRAETQAPLSVTTGLYFALRVFFVLLAVRAFQADASVGVAASLATNGLLLLIALLSPARKLYWTERQLYRQPCFLCVTAYFLLSGASLFWTIADSLPAACAFWVAMVADAGIVVLQMRVHPPRVVLEALGRGYVYGAALVALIAWIMPAQSDMRLGDEEWLGPNQIGWVCAFGFFFAQYLIRRKAAGSWSWYAALLGLTLLRSLSKTTIIAFVLAQFFLLWKDTTIARRVKTRILYWSALTIVPFVSLLWSYLEDYGNSNSPESLTGRLGIWTYLLGQGLEEPLLGHGFHSVWKVVPLFYGDFQARHAHNELLQQFYAYGIVGLLLMILTYVRLGVVIRRMDVRDKAFWGSLLVFVVVRGIADTEAFDYSWPMWLLVVFGAIASPTLMAEKSLP